MALTFLNNSIRPTDVANCLEAALAAYPGEDMMAVTGTGTVSKFLHGVAQAGVPFNWRLAPVRTYKIRRKAQNWRMRQFHPNHSADYYKAWNKYRTWLKSQPIVGLGVPTCMQIRPAVSWAITPLT
jgi:hypothetical protein